MSRVRGQKLRVGMVFTIDPMIWIREERLYFRIEDMAVITKNGVINTPKNLMGIFNPNEKFILL